MIPSSVKIDEVRRSIVWLGLALLSACANLGSDDVPPQGGLSALAQQAYIKASNTDAYDHFGTSIALSADGSTLAVGANSEDSTATGVGGNQANNSSPHAGAVYVFTRNGTTWHQQAYVKASNTDYGDSFGTSIALSVDGSTLAVGAPGESSTATGIGGNQADNSAPGAGAVYVFTRSDTTWSQESYIKASNTGEADSFGFSVALSANGSVLAVGAPGDDSAATGVGGNQADDSAPDAGAVYVFTRSEKTWNQQAYIKASNTGLADSFGYHVALSADGSIFAVGAPGEDSATTGIGGNQADNSAAGAGAVYVFTRNDTTWSQQAYVKASNPQAGDLFGCSIALSDDGSTLAAGAYHESSAATGIGGNQADDSVSRAGAVYVFTQNHTTWDQQAYIKASNTGVNDAFGASITLSSNGSTLAVGAYWEASAATGVNENQADNSTPYAGAVYVFTRSSTAWSQQAYVKASNPGLGDDFGTSVALSADGSTLAVSAQYEPSAATGINGDQADYSAANAGAAYVFQ
jgi:hypothetical protein